jgi:CDP-diglyceride synthetase
MDFPNRFVHSLWLISLSLFGVYKGGSYLVFILACICTFAYSEWFLLSECQQLLPYRPYGFVVIAIFQQSIIAISSSKRNLCQLFVIVWTTDTFSYLMGNFIGGTKLSTYSPNKTVSGFLSGLFMGTLAGSAMGLSLQKSFLVSLSGQIGDFLESIVKRIANVKDSNLPGLAIPGHGGVLDRIDSLILATPVFYALSLIK